MSEDIIARHERDGDLSCSEAGYFCNICSAALGQQPLPHLRGANHTNAVFLLALSQPTKYWARYIDIPERIRTALEKGEIVCKEKKVMCTLCDVPLSKEKTVNDHLLSSIHVTKAASPQLFSPLGAGQLPFWLPIIPHQSSPQPFKPHRASLEFDESGLGQEAPSTTVGRAESPVTHALRNGHIKRVQAGGIDGLTCIVCGNANVITGDTPMRQHLLGKTHLKNAMKHELSLQQMSGALALPQPISPPSSNVDQLPVQRPSFFDQHQIPYHHQDQVHSPQNQYNDQQQSPHYQNPSYSPQNQFNNHPNLTHQQNINQEQRTNQQQYSIVNSFPSLTLNVTVGGSQISHPMNQHDPSPHPAASSKPFRTNFKPRTSRGHPYKIDSSPRGIVVIFNYYFEGQGKYQRDGAAADYQNVRQVFTMMDYEVWPENVDLTRQKTLEKLDEIMSSRRLGMVDSFITFFLSHGGDSPDAFRTVDGEIMSVEEIYTKFTDAECPQLRRKPKLFFFNFCRGKTKQLQSDSWTPSSAFATAPKDVAIIQAALPHFAAKRHTETGTVFVDCLCEVLGECAGSLDLHDIVQQTSLLMQQRQGTTASVLYIDFGKFNFLD